MIRCTKGYASEEFDTPKEILINKSFEWNTTR